MLTLPEVKSLHLMSRRCKMCMLSVCNLICHKFLHATTSCALSGKKRISPVNTKFSVGETKYSVCLLKVLKYVWS